ncbi:single-stranded DNA-binding protein [Corynebacterium amycolatum]|uniref:single-stranded DNA-binding protein n=1 Tax=Corynebacterium amycolatum TaxID=43765 RepID=UPI00191D378E|nr:single-stranded DNA-binding protein [Corynebacterium amycolatum]QQU97766.1 single-stranded DNA-binding protein [Corynebacterium amycolatum]
MAQGDIYTTIVGNLVADPELKYTNTGTPVTSFRVVSSTRVYRDGQWQDGDAVFMTCSVWREQAENMAECLRKGMRVLVHGRLKQRSYENKQGEKRTVYQVDADDVGPSLKFATADVRRMQRSSAPKDDGWLSQQQGNNNGAGGADPWNSAPSSEPFPDNDQPPF